MNKIIITGTILGSLFLFGCGNQETETNTDVVVDNVEETVIENVVVEESPHDLVLINNQKWEIDEGMKISIDSIEMRMADFDTQTLESFSELSTDLARHTKLVISSCTMKGQAHDELHKWLLPFIDLRKELNGITEISEGQDIVNRLNEELVVFDTYFEK